MKKQKNREGMKQNNSDFGDLELTTRMEGETEEMWDQEQKNREGMKQNHSDFVDLELTTRMEGESKEMWDQEERKEEETIERKKKLKKES